MEETWRQILVWDAQKRFRSQDLVSTASNESNDRVADNEGNQVEDERNQAKQKEMH